MIEIIDIQTSLGSIKEKNADIEDLVGWAASEIQKKTGIRQRFISDDNETTESLALDSFSKVLKKNNIKELIVASSSEVYHSPIKIPTDETESIKIPDIFNPRFSYSTGKILTEIMSINNSKHFKKTNVQKRWSY